MRRGNDVAEVRISELPAQRNDPNDTGTASSTLDTTSPAAMLSETTDVAPRRVRSTSHTATPPPPLSSNGTKNGRTEGYWPSSTTQSAADCSFEERRQIRTVHVVPVNSSPPITSPGNKEPSAQPLTGSLSRSMGSQSSGTARRDTAARQISTPDDPHPHNRLRDEHFEEEPRGSGTTSAAADSANSRSRDNRTQTSRDTAPASPDGATRDCKRHRPDNGIITSTSAVRGTRSNHSVSSTAECQRKNEQPTVDISAGESSKPTHSSRRQTRYPNTDHGTGVVKSSSRTRSKRTTSDGSRRREPSELHDRNVFRARSPRGMNSRCDAKDKLCRGTREDVCGTTSSPSSSLSHSSPTAVQSRGEANASASRALSRHLHGDRSPSFRPRSSDTWATGEHLELPRQREQTSYNDPAYGCPSIVQRDWRKNDSSPTAVSRMLRTNALQPGRRESRSPSNRRSPPAMSSSNGNEGGFAPVKSTQFLSKPPGTIESPPPPLQPPYTIAQLRLLLIVGLISSETVPPASLMSQQSVRFTLSCPIHSAMVAQIIRDYFTIHCHVFAGDVAGIRGSLISRELQLLALGFHDPFCGPVAPLLNIDVIGPGSVILSSFDFLRCDHVLRSALRPEHPSLGAALWDPTCPAAPPRWPLPLGAGLGVEAREAQLMQLLLPEVDEEDNGLPSENLYHGGAGSSGCDEAFGTAGRPSTAALSQQEFSRDDTSGIPFARGAVNGRPLSDAELLPQYPSIPPNPRSTGGHFGMPLGGKRPVGAPGRGGLGLLSAGGSGGIASLSPAGNAQFPATPLHSRSLPRRPPVAGFTHPSEAAVTGMPRGQANHVGAASMAPTDSASIEALLSVPSAKEQQLRESGAELRQLLTVPTAKHSITTRQFQNRGGSRVQQICRHGTRHDCLEAAISTYNQRRLAHPDEPPPKACGLIHFRRILLPHTDVSLGDCSYLDTCRHMASCRFVHYEVDLDVGSAKQKSELLERMEATDQASGVAHNIGTVFSGHLEELPAQWITCDVRKFDFSIFRGKVKVVMADPPWDIHMDLPYGTMTDAEMKALRLDQVQDEGCLFLWVTGRAMELGRECMKLWGYRQVEEIVWVKTNQLHRIIRTGRTGHWLNHSKEHCLVGTKGTPKLNRNLDTDIIVAEVRETSRKPDEIYRIIERLCPGPYKLELFGRPHNVRDNWITLGNQLDNVHLHDPQLIQRYNVYAQTAGMQPFTPVSTAAGQLADKSEEE